MVFVQSFCCGCSLEQGTVFSGIVSTFRAILSILAGSFMVICLPTRYSESGYEDPLHVIVIAWAAAAIGFGMIVLVVSGLLFFGVANGNPGYIFPWIVWHSIDSFFGLCLFFFSIIFGGMSMIDGLYGKVWRSGYHTSGQLIRTSGFFSVAMIYLYIVVLSYYKSLQVSPPDQVPVQMTQINIHPDGYNQSLYVVNIDQTTSNLAPLTAYDTRPSGMVSLPGYNSIMQGPASGSEYDSRIPMVEPSPGFDTRNHPLNVKEGITPPEYPQSAEYTTNPPPYSAPPPYSVV